MSQTHPPTYRCVLTEGGAALDAKARATGIPVRLTHIAVGDGNGTVPDPSESATALVHEVMRAGVERIYQDEQNPHIIWLEMTIPATSGGWWIREVGVYATTDEGMVLFAVGNHAPYHKVIVSSGMAEEHTLKIPVIVSSDTVVSLTLNSAVLATLKEVHDEVAKVNAEIDSRFAEKFEDEGNGKLKTSELPVAGPGTLGGITPGAQLDVKPEGRMDVTMQWSAAGCYPLPTVVLHQDKLWVWHKASGPCVSDGSKEPGTDANYWMPLDSLMPKPKVYELCEFYYFRHPTLRPGFQPAQGGVISNAATLYPDAWAYLQTAEGQRLCKTESEWQALTTATWATLADGSKVGWDGIGGAPFYALHLDTGALRLPDLRGMHVESAGFAGLDVGGSAGDTTREIEGVIALGAGTNHIVNCLSGPFFAGPNGPSTVGAQYHESAYQRPTMRISRVVPVGPANAPRRWGALACVYLGTPTS